MTPPERASPSRFPWLAVLGIFALALIGVVLLVAMVISLARGPAQPRAAASPSPMPLLTSVVAIPTTTAGPTNTPVVEALPTSTPLPATEAPTAEPTDSGRVVTAAFDSNVRSGPGLNYPIVGGINQGSTAPVVGRDSLGAWFAIEFEAAPEGQGWIAAQVVSYAGDITALLVVDAPAPPANNPPPATQRPANTAAPAPTSPPATAAPPAGTRLSGSLRLCDARTTFAAGERVCFVESIKNNTSGAISYGILGVQITNVGAQTTTFHTSWSGTGHPNGLLWIDAGCEGPLNRCNGPWEDGVTLSSAGTYQLRLSICYSDVNTCPGGGQWETLTGPVTVTIN